MPSKNISESLAEAIAKAFITEQVEEYDYDLIKEFVWEGIQDKEDDQYYSDLVSDVCEAMKRVKVIVKFSR